MEVASDFFLGLTVIARDIALSAGDGTHPPGLGPGFEFGWGNTSNVG
jgi:hypothetical protein